MLYLDIETDGLNPTTIWVVGVAEDKKQPFPIYSADDLQRLLNRHDAVVAHNGIRFDFPVLERLWGIDFSNTRKVDTYVLSSLASPNRDGGHSLSNFGRLLGYEKGDHNDWSRLSPEMITYCLRDVEVLRKATAMLTDELSDFSNGCADLEMKVADIICRQEQRGFFLDVPKATALWQDCTVEMAKIERQLQEVFPPVILERYSEKTGKRLQDKVVVFNVGSRKQIGERLKGLGVKFTKFTPGGQPVVDESVLSKIDVPEAQMIARFLLLQKRAAQVDSWLKAADSEGRVHGRVRTNGAVTGRMTHSNPNMAQIPSTRADLGKECRACWTVPDGYKLVGIDASALELRMLAHYMRDDGFTEAVLRGKQEDGTDVHSRNQAIAGLPTRSDAKTFILTVG